MKVRQIKSSKYRKHKVANAKYVNLLYSQIKQNVPRVTNLTENDVNLYLNLFLYKFQEKKVKFRERNLKIYGKCVALVKFENKNKWK